MSIRVTTSGLDEARAFVARLADVGEALEEPIAETVEAQVERRIGVEKTAPDGGTWPAWSASYARSGKAREMLERSGALLRSVTHIIRGDTIEVGSDLPYARRQQQRRPFLGLGAQDKQELDGVIQGVLERFVRAA